MSTFSVIVFSVLALVLWAALIFCADHDRLVNSLLCAAIAVIVVVLVMEVLQ